jgi:hypothetical protein
MGIPKYSLATMTIEFFSAIRSKSWDEQKRRHDESV